MFDLFILCLYMHGPDSIKRRMAKPRHRGGPIDMRSQGSVKNVKRSVSFGILGLIDDDLCQS